jgi:hypothetical protein
LRDIVNGIVGLPRVQVFLDAFAHIVLFGEEVNVRLGLSAIGGQFFSQADRDFVEKARGQTYLRLSSTEPAPIPGPRQVKPLLRPRHGDVTKTALLFHRAFSRQGAAVREDAFFETSHKYIRKLEPFGVVNGKERNGCFLI